jgi:hypothetical protein
MLYQAHQMVVHMVTSGRFTGKATRAATYLLPASPRIEAYSPIC